MFCNEKRAITRGKEIIYLEHRGWEVGKATNQPGDSFGRPHDTREVIGAGKPGYMDKANFFATKSKANTKAAWSKMMMTIQNPAVTLTAVEVVNSISRGYLKKIFPIKKSSGK